MQILRMIGKKKQNLVNKNKMRKLFVIGVFLCLHIHLSAQTQIGGADSPLYFKTDKVGIGIEYLTVCRNGRQTPTKDEELTLYLIEQNKKANKQAEEIQVLKSENELLKKEINILKTEQKWHFIINR